VPTTSVVSIPITSQSFTLVVALLFCHSCTFIRVCSISAQSLPMCVSYVLVYKQFR